MSINQIKEVKSVDSENFDFLLAQSNHRIESVLKSSDSKPIQANVNILSQIVTAPVDTANYATNIGHYLPSSIQKTHGSQRFNFTIDPVDYAVYDLRDAEFNIQVQYAYEDTADAAPIVANYPTFGNQCLLSLFEYVELYIDGKCVGRMNTPGMNSNANYALRYPHCKSLEKNYEINGYMCTDKSKYSQLALKTATADEIVKDFDNQSITIQCVLNNTRALATKALFTGIITQRIKLSDMFFFIKTLPPLYKHKTEIRFLRNAHNYLICNTNSESNVKCECIGINKFELRQDVLNITDQLIQSMEKAYASPIETLVTMEKQQLVDFMTEPATGSGTSFNINLETAYKNKLLTIAIPRTNNFTRQYNKTESRYDVNKVPLSIDNTSATKHYDTFKAPANSYTYGGIRALTISTQNGAVLYRFFPEVEGFVEGASTVFRLDKPETQLNFHNNSDGVKFANYEDVYKQYLRARRHFWEEENEGLDFETFMKEYCVYCVDLSQFTLSPGETLTVDIQYSDWTGNYNPYYTNNYKGGDHEYYSTRLMCNLYYDKVLKIGKGVFELKPMFDPEKQTTEEINMA